MSRVLRPSFALLLSAAVLAGCASDATSPPDGDPSDTTGTYPHDPPATFIDSLLVRMTIEQKVGQMVQAEIGSVTPDDVFTIYYDSRRNLLARGILPRPHFSGRTPDPFPGGFVPDP